MRSATSMTFAPAGAGYSPARPGSRSSRRLSHVLDVIATSATSETCTGPPLR
jgi:hypothetical protein